MAIIITKVFFLIFLPWATRDPHSKICLKTSTYGDAPVMIVYTPSKNLLIQSDTIWDNESPSHACLEDFTRSILS